MNVLSDNYAAVLSSMNVAPETVAQARELFAAPELKDALENPFVSKAAKRRVIDQLFPEAIKNFVKVMSDNGDIAFAGDIFDAYDALLRKRANACRAVFTYMTQPDDEQIEKLKTVICRQYHKSSVELAMKEDSSIIGGFILAVDDYVLDKSLRTAMLRMQRHFAAR